ncbi:Tuberous sclerosis 2-like protein [Elasticomyces elasticus]|nr:Tuberous sclerosis 2-like protein [Elasticomyces elasticus]
MSPPVGDATKTPERRVSHGGVLGAFTLKHFSSMRGKSPPLPTPSNFLTLTPAQASLTRQKSRGHIPTQRPNTDLGENDGTSTWLGLDVNKSTMIQKQAAGRGPAEVDALLQQLGPGSEITKRISAAKALCQIIEEYPVAQVTEIWAATEDLITADNYPEDAVRAGYDLLTSLVKHAGLNARERRSIFNSVSAPQADAFVYRRYQAFADLSNHGKTLEALEDKAAPLLAELLMQSSQAAFKLRSRERSSKLKTASKEESTLSGVFQLSLNVVKFNSRSLREEDVDVIVMQLLQICQKTSLQADVVQCLGIVEAIVTYAELPASSVPQCIQVLCNIYSRLENLQAPVWNTLGHLLRSHLGHLSVTILLECLSPNSTGVLPATGIMLGAIMVLHRVMLKLGKDGFPSVSMSLLLAAYKRCLDSSNLLLREPISQSLLEIFEVEELVGMLVDEDDWSDLMCVIATCATRDSDLKASLSEPSVRRAAVKQNATQTQDDPGDACSDNLRAILQHVARLTHRFTIDRKVLVMGLFLNLADYLSDDMAQASITDYASQRLLYPSTSAWLTNFEQIIKAFLVVRQRPVAIRILALNVCKDAYNTIETICSPKDVSTCAGLVLSCIAGEEDLAVVNALVNFAVSATDDCSEDLFDTIVEALSQAALQQNAASAEGAVSVGRLDGSGNSTPALPSLQSPGTPQMVIVRGLVCLFVRNITKSARRSLFLFGKLLDIAKSEGCQADARVAALKLLFRLRSDINHRIFVLDSTESEGLAAALCRTVQTANSVHAVQEEPDRRASRNTDSGQPPSNKYVNNLSPHTSLTRLTTRSAGTVPRVSRATPPAWMYGGLQGLPEKPPDIVSNVVYSVHEESDVAVSDAYGVPDFSLWLEFVISALQHGCDWEVYSYILVHLGAQLTNRSLFVASTRQIKMLRGVVCEQLRQSSFHEPPPFTGLRKADVAVCLFQILTMLISYHEYFAKSEEDDMVKIFLFGIGAWDRTSINCVHSLTVCCHELPLSVSKSLDSILQKMSQIITQSQVAMHVLEFLTGLSLLPDLYKNFREEDYKTVFAVCFRYLQTVRDQRDRKVLHNSQRDSVLRHSGTPRDFARHSDQSAAGKDATDDLPQYVYTLAYHTIAYWFIAVRLQDRPTHMEWIKKQLTFKDREGADTLEDQGLVTIDMMERVSFSDREETVADPEFAKPKDGTVIKKTWVVGHSLLTIETAARTGASQITRRRPSGTRYSKFRPQLTSPPRHQIPITTGTAADAFYTSDYVGMLPDDIFQEFYSPLNIDPTHPLAELPMVLPEDDATDRAISSFDRISPLDGHKVGVIYIGEGQRSETDILANAMGSPDYVSFYSGLGTLTRLKGATMNTQGLDREYDTDGEFTYCWRDRVTEIVFHITTLMPTNIDHDPQCIKKKSHIGNDFVNIVFNNSGEPFRFDTFPSSFNYVYIVVTPEARASFVETRFRPNNSNKGGGGGDDQCYKVQLLSQSGFPHISSAAETKIVSARSLPAFVRTLALNASVFSQVWLHRESGEYVSSWRHRLRQIQRLRESHKPRKQQPPSQVEGAAAAEAQRMTMPGARDGGNARRTSAATFQSESTSRSSGPNALYEGEKNGSESSRG